MVDEEKGLQAKSEVIQVRKPTKIRITRRQLREHIHTYVAANGRLDEAGFLDFLTGILDKIGGAFDGALSVDTGKIAKAPKHPKGKSITSVDDLEPKKDPWDQVVAVTWIAQNLQFAVEAAIQMMGFAKEDIEDPIFEELPQTEAEKKDFAERFTYVIDNISKAYGQFVGYIREGRAGKKLNDIGNDAEPGETVVKTLEQMAEIIERVEALDVPSQTNKILNSDAVQAELEKDDQLRAFAQDARVYVEGVEKMSELKAIMEEIFEKVKEIEEVVTKSGEAKKDEPEAEDVAKSELLSHYDPRHDSLRALIRENIMRRSS